MRISLIIPVYNVSNYLPRLMETVLSQTLNDLEVILVDDGSSDDSGRICDGYAANDPRVKVIHKSNSSVSDARNAGIESSSGEYLVLQTAMITSQKTMLNTF